MPDRYELYGVIPTERDVNTAPMALDEQNIGDSGQLLLYTTNDADEARAIYEAGGFERDGVWHAVTRVVDLTKRMGHSQPAAMPNKRDYDQS